MTTSTSQRGAVLSGPPGDRGAVVLDGAGRIEAGDTVRLTAAGSPAITADAADRAEVLIWERAA